MSKIPDDIMQAAGNALGDGPEFMLPDYGVNEEALVNAIARAILSERLRIAEIMEEVRRVLERLDRFWKDGLLHTPDREIEAIKADARALLSKLKEL